MTMDKNIQTIITDEHIEKLISETSSPTFLMRMEEFVSFMEQPIGDRKLIDILNDILAYPINNSILDDSEILTLTKAKKLVQSFYATFNEEVGARVKDILSNNDPEVKLAITENSESTSTGNVNHSGMDTYITLNCTYNNTLYGSIVLAHETGHALSNNLTILAKLTQKMIATSSPSTYNSYLKNRKKFSALKPLTRDAVGEIESHIFEDLYCDFLREHDIISEEYLENFKNTRAMSLYNNILTLIEDYTYIKNLDFPIDKDKITKKISSSGIPLGHIQDFTKRFNKHGFMFQHRIRYVIGEIIATDWMNKYNSAPTQRTKSQMKHRLVEYLDKCYSHDIESACSQLLKKEFSTVVQDFTKAHEYTDSLKEDYNEQNLL